MTTSPVVAPQVADAIHHPIVCPCGRSTYIYGARFDPVIYREWLAVHGDHEDGKP